MGQVTSSFSSDSQEIPRILRKPKCSLPCSHQSIIWRCLQLDKSSPRTPILHLWDLL